MKKFTPIFAIILSFLMLLQSVPVSASSVLSLSKTTSREITQNDSPTAEKNAGSDIKTTLEEPYILEEDISRREENVKHFKMSDGTYKAAVYASPVHFMENGEWKDIDNSITLSSTDTRKLYTAEISDAEFTFPDKLSEGEHIRIKKNGHEISFGYLNGNFTDISSSEIVSDSNSVKKKDNNIGVESGILKYNNISPSTDIEYELNSTMLKESIIVSSRQSEYIYKFSLNIGNLTPVTNGDGSISLIDKNNKNSLEYVIAAPFMIDAEGIFSDSVTMSLTASGDEYILNVTADKEWLNAEDRSFPVVIDPTLLYQPNRINDIFDTYVDSGSPTTNHYLSTYSIVGHNSLGTGRSYIKFNLPELPHCGVIINAQLGLIQMGYDPGNGVTNHMVVYESPSEQNYQTLTWANQPSLTSQPIVDYTVFKSGSNGSVSYILDITKIAKNWFETGINYGLFLASANESSSWRSTIYTSNYTGYDAYPMIQISYVDNKGLENYWSYETIDMGRSGAVYINEYNGLLTYVHQDIALGGNITYLSAAHIYSNEHKGAAPYGYGFSVTAEESITLITSGALYNEGYRAYLTDSDGTAHYFKYVSSTEMKYEFDDNLILKKNGSTYELKNEDGSKRTYDASGKLLTIIDRNGNTITHTYDSSGRIYKITDAIGRTFTYNYNSSGYLASVTDAAGRNTVYTYSGGYLNTITYPDGKTTVLTYLSNKLFNIKQVDSTNISFLYTSSGRINTVSIKGTDSTVLKNIYFNYKGSNTVITDSAGRSITVGFDNMGRAVSSSDKNGNITTAKYNNGGNINNKLAESSDIFSFADNKLLNHSFENGFTDWKKWQPEGTSSYSVVTSQKYIGSKSLKLSLSTQGKIVALQDLTDFEIGKEYTLSAYVKVASLNNSDTSVRIEGKDASGTVTRNFSSRIDTITDGWVRLQVSYTVPAGVTYIRICLELAGTSGTVYYDALQFEETSSAGHYNLLSNPGFESYSSNTFTGWTVTGTVSAVSGMVNASTGVAIAGSPSSNARLMQSVTLGTSSNERTLVFGGAIKGNCAASSNNEGSNAKVGLLLELYSGTALVASKTVEYNAYAIDTVQLLSDSITADTSVDSAKIYLLYDKNVNTAYFDNIFLYIDNFGTKYSYDSDGKLISQRNNAGDAISYTYTGVDIAKISVMKNGEEKDSYTYTYDSNHNVLTETTKNGIITEYSYPTSGNRGMPTAVTVKNSSGSVQSSNTYTYSSNYNYTMTVTDARGKTVLTAYSPTKDLLTSTVDADGTIYYYSYNALNDELREVYTENEDGFFDVVYSYNTNGQLSSISQDGVNYNFSYDVFGRRTATKVGSQTLASYSYNNKGLLASTAYGNGTVHSLTYDDSDRVISEAFDGTTVSSYSYNTEGYLGKTIDHSLGITTYYGYDLVGRVTDIDTSDGVSADFSYNEYNSIAGYKVSKNSSVVSKADFIYNAKGLPESVQTNNSAYNEFTYSYDELNRLVSKSHPVSETSVSTVYIYTQGANSNTTGLVNFIGYMNGNEQLMPMLGYTYDNNGNISSVSKNGVTHITYTYDSLGRLVREDNKDLDATIVYTYDERGNILSKEYYNYTTGTLGSVNDTINYTYDSVWKDKLIDYSGFSFSYDNIGNLTEYFGFTLNWEKGRQLKSFAVNGMDIVAFEYNADGLRTKKYIGFENMPTSYIWSAGLLVQQTDGTNTLNFSYSPDGRPLEVLFNGEAYYYIYNLQGDVIGLYDRTGTVVVEYTYDSWGMLIDTTGSLASTLGYLNPFRYRGYIYDEEIGLYWLRTRYYAPSIGRFLNADGYISTGTGLNGYNMFAYCGNNPIMLYDPTGEIYVPPFIVVLFVLGITLLVPSSQAQIPTEDQIEDANSAAERADLIVRKDEYGNPYTVDIQINTKDVIDSVDSIARTIFYNILYDRTVEEAKSNNIPVENLMSKFHIQWEFELHMIAYGFGIKNAITTDLNVEETPWSMFMRAIGW